MSSSSPISERLDYKKSVLRMHLLEQLELANNYHELVNNYHKFKKSHQERSLSTSIEFSRI